MKHITLGLRSWRLQVTGESPLKPLICPHGPLPACLSNCNEQFYGGVADAQPPRALPDIAVYIEERCRHIEVCAASLKTYLETDSGDQHNRDPEDGDGGDIEALDKRGPKYRREDEEAPKEDGEKSRAEENKKAQGDDLARNQKDWERPRHTPCIRENPVQDHTEAALYPMVLPCHLLGLPPWTSMETRTKSPPWRKGFEGCNVCGDALGYVKCLSSCTCILRAGRRGNEAAGRSGLIWMQDHNDGPAAGR